MSVYRVEMAFHINISSLHCHLQKIFKASLAEGFTVEVASSNRAGCTNTECKQNGIKIAKGTLRLGVLVTIKEHQSWKWKHWGCVTPKQIVGVKSSIEDNLDLFDGFDELPDDLQEKVKTALADGHIADDDWTGDIEMNRPGKNGYRTPATKKQKREEAKAEKEAEAGGESENASPSKPGPGKRGRVKAEANSEHGEDEEPAPKKRKTVPKKSKKNAQEETNGAAEIEPKPIKRERKMAKKPKNEASSSVPVKDESSDHDAAPSAQAKKDRKNARRPKKEVESPVDIKNEASDDEVMPPPTAKKARAAPKISTTKKNKREEAEGDATADMPKPAITVPAKETGSRSTAATRKANEEDATSNGEMEAADQPGAKPANESNPVTAEQGFPDEPEKSVTRKKRNGNKSGRKNEAKNKSEHKGVATPKEATKSKNANTRAKRAPA